MNNKRMLAILIIVLAITILAIIIYFLFFYRLAEDVNVFKEADTQGELAGSPSTLEEARMVVKKIPQNEKEEVTATDGEINEANLVKTAASFAERFGSYSNHSDYENISDLKIFMDKKMLAWADSFVKLSREKSDYSEIYQGVITKAISSEVRKLNEETGNAEILVKTQRIESSGSKNNSSTKYEDILIIFIKEGGVWKVDGAYWQ